MILRRILIANRGEIAVRILRTCQQLGTDADRDSLAARLADAVVPVTSYLSVESVVSAAVLAGAQAVHPGYGFLSENAQLARACDKAGVVFIGASADQLEAAGDKVAAREHAVAAGLPVLPGGEVTDPARIRELAAQIGFPLLIKATAGGGGRGLRPVLEPGAPSDGTLADAVSVAMAEAGASFGDPRVYLERYVRSGRHVEVQLLGDGERVIHIGDRDCSVQRRYQKLIEEAPAPLLAQRLRERLHRAAVAFGEHLRYRGLGTVEFLVDRESGEFFFLEMNARIQVEHPVTEAVTGLDLVAEQIWVAEGNPLRLSQDDITLTGHAIECRVNAEDWTDSFRPSPGTVIAATFPSGSGFRVDTHVQPGCSVPPWYDSLLAKLVGIGRDRAEALAYAQRAVADCEIRGVATTLGLHAAVLASDEFAAGGVDTQFLPRFLDLTGSEVTSHG
jgi:acetyl-CoA carboxylase, biotin carboxylase subunit